MSAHIAAKRGLEEKMNEVIGYDESVPGHRFPRFSGPCKGCGAVNYGLSTSGPDYCGSCACGTPPEVSKLRRELEKLRNEYIDLVLALQIATGFKVGGMTPQMRERGEHCLDRFKADKSMHG